MNYVLWYPVKSESSEWHYLIDFVLVWSDERVSVSFSSTINTESKTSLLLSRVLMCPLKSWCSITSLYFISFPVEVSMKLLQLSIIYFDKCDQYNINESQEKNEDFVNQTCLLEYHLEWVRIQCWTLFNGKNKLQMKNSSSGLYSWVGYIHRWFIAQDCLQTCM